jgi:hypothetical protein
VRVMPVHPRPGGPTTSSRHRCSLWSATSA